MMRGRIAHAPMSQPASPTRLNRNEMRERAVPRRRSLTIAMIAPAPAQTPSTAATIGCGQPRIALTRSPVMRVNASRPAVSILVSGPMISCTSPPEQKFSPAPLTTTALIDRSAVRLRNRSRSSAYDSKVSGFLRSGRFSVTRPSGPSTDH
jgi:hypothetical protein